MRDKKDISESIEVLKANLEYTARVAEWAELMGYTCPKRFARKFVRYFAIRPQTCLKYVRLQSISKALRNEKKSNFEIARKHGIPDEIALNKFINYHLNCSPSQVKRMPENLLWEKVERFGSKVR
jgi:transcriptional regulator GlxA family with amidase domain